MEIIYQRQPVNIGGSGGFHEGLKLAVSLPVEWVWIMDGDAFPEKSALLKLVEHTGDNGVVALSSVVKNKKGEVITCLYRILSQQMIRISLQII